MDPMLADAINFPLVFMYGMAVLVPLMLFQVCVEALILRCVWHVSFREMTRFAFRANCWSLAAGIPTKILNAVLYGMLLPRDIPGFFARYPFAVGVGTLVYFVVTVLVELICAVRWRQTNEPSLTRRSLWNGILLANLATYTVLAPLHYYATRPMSDVSEFTQDTLWSGHSRTRVVFVDSDLGHLKSTRLDGSTPETIVPLAAKDYLLSLDTAVCLFREEGGSLVLYHRTSGESNLVWQTEERFSMNQVAFSPLAERVAFASETGGFIEVVDVRTGKRTRQKLRANARDFNVAWSTEEAKLFICLDGGNRFAVTITPEFSLTLDPLSGTNQPPLLACYGRVGPGRWSGGGDWGQSYDNDSCGDLRAWAEPGLGSNLRIYRDGGRSERVLTLSVNPGLLHLASVYFGDVAFLEGCQECVFEASGWIYLADFERKRLGTVAHGERFILLTPRYQKQL